MCIRDRVRTFCMNPGGIVSEEHYEGGVGGKGIAVVNGHSYADEDKHSENTNFAMLVSTKFNEPFNQMCIRDSTCTRRSWPRTRDRSGRNAREPFHLSLIHI